MSKRIVLLAAAVGCAVGCDCAARELGLADINSVSNRVASLDWNAFRSEVVNQGLEIGSIMSAWYVNKMGATNAAYELEIGRRNLGLGICGLVTKTADEVNKSHDIPQLETAASNLLWLASWLAPHAGYGNILIEGRAYDVASVAVARLFCNTNYPLEKYPGWLMVTNVSWDRTERRARILFLESDGFGFSPKMTNQTFDGLSAEWRACRKKLAVGSPLGEFFAEHKISNPRIFFVPEEGWTNALHQRVMFGLATPSDTRSGLEPLYVFRKTVGYFPLNSTDGKPRVTGTGVLAGFWDAWWPHHKQRYSDEKYSDIGENAGRIYDRYVKGTLVDEGTRWIGYPDQPPK